jgi:hypothetical protein
MSAECYVCGDDKDDTVSLGKHEICSNCLGLPNGENIEINFEEGLMLKLMIQAHEENVPFNSFIGHTLREFTENETAKTRIEKEEQDQQE